MLTCYCCGKLLLGKKILGQVGPAVYQFCSESCRNKTWNKIGVQDPSTLEVSSKEIMDESKVNYVRKNVVVKSGSASSVQISGAEYTFDKKTDRVTMKVKYIGNKNSGTTGVLKLELFLSKSGKYSEGASLSGVVLAESNTYDPLKKNYSYSDVVSVVRKKNTPKPGSYQPVLFVRELNEDGSWKIAGFVNFPSCQRW